MAIYLTRRLFGLVIVLIAMSFIIFCLQALIPADPARAIAGPSAPMETVEALRQQLGLDDPLIEQYGRFLARLVTGDLGMSIYFRQPVVTLVGNSLPATLELSLVSLVMALLIAIPGGIVLYLLNRRRGELLADFVLVLLLSIPSFLWGIILIIVFGVLMPVLPFMGRTSGVIGSDLPTGFLLFDLLWTGRWRDWQDAVAHLMLPALALALGFSPLVARVLRASLIETATEQYVSVARLRGLSETRVLLRHMLGNAALPTLTLIGVQFGFLFGGTLLIEVIFSFPGIGNLMVQAIKNHDLMLIQGVALVFCLMVLAVNFVVDALYAVLNPRLGA